MAGGKLMVVIEISPRLMPPYSEPTRIFWSALVIASVIAAILSWLLWG